MKNQYFDDVNDELKDRLPRALAPADEEASPSLLALLSTWEPLDEGLPEVQDLPAEPMDV